MSFLRTFHWSSPTSVDGKLYIISHMEVERGRLLNNNTVDHGDPLSLSMLHPYLSHRLLPPSPSSALLVPLPALGVSNRESKDTARHPLQLSTAQLHVLN